MRALAIMMFSLLTSLTPFQTNGVLPLKVGKNVASALQEGWKFDNFIINETAPSYKDFLILKKENHLAFYKNDQFIAESESEKYQLHYYPHKSDYLLVYKRGKKAYLRSKRFQSKGFEQINLYQSNIQNYPIAILNNRNQASFYDGENMIGPVSYKKIIVHQQLNQQYLIEIQQKSIQQKGKLKKECQLIENGQLSSPLEQILFSTLVGKEICYLYQGNHGNYFIKQNLSLSKPYTQAILVTKELFILMDKNQQWFLFHNGTLYGPYLEKPLAIKKVGNTSSVWVAKTPKGWHWYKNGQILTKTDYYRFTKKDIHIYKQQFALIRKINNKYEIYSNSKKQVAFLSKPSFKLLNKKLLIFEGSSFDQSDKASLPQPFYGLSQLENNKLLIEKKPIDVHLFKEDFFDFWIKRGNQWSAYHGGKVVGTIDTDEIEKIQTFIIHNRLFFPTYLENGLVMLKSQTGSLGPFNKVTPFEHPNQIQSDSTLFSSFTATTPQGDIAVYGDTIIGPYDRIYPNRDYNNSGKILGLFIEVADLYYYFTTQNGMELQNQTKIKSIKLNKDGSIHKEYESIDVSTDRQIAVEKNKEQRNLLKSNKISIFWESKLIGKTEKYKIKESNGRYYIQLTPSHALSPRIILPSGKRIVSEHIYQVELSDTSEMVVYQKGKQAVLFYQNLLSKKKKSIKINQLYKVLFYQKGLKNSRNPPWFVVQRKLGNQNYIQVNNGEKALFLQPITKESQIDFKLRQGREILIVEIKNNPESKNMIRLYFDSQGLRNDYCLMKNEVLLQIIK